MTTNTDPVRAHDELRVQAALLRTPEFMAQFDPEKFARQLERIATALASAPPSAPVGVERLRRMVEKLAAHVRPTCSELWEEAQAALAQQPAAPSGEAVGSDDRRERLLERRNVLNNSFGSGAYCDGRVQQQIDAIDAELATLAAPQQQGGAE